MIEQVILISFFSIITTGKLIKSTCDYMIRRKYLKFIFKKIFRNKNRNDCCVICQDDYTENNKCVKLYCGHIFHLDCTYDWFNEKLSCPLCNKMLLTRNGDSIDNYYYLLPQK